MMNKNTEKFIGNKISITTYNKLIAYSETTGQKMKRIINDALDNYLKEEIPKQYEPKKD